MFDIKQIIQKLFNLLSTKLFVALVFCFNNLKTITK